MEPVRLQVILSFTLVGRSGIFVSGQLLAGTITENDEPMVLVSEDDGDHWQVSLKSLFSPATKAQVQIQKALWEKGERPLWFTPLDAMRPIREKEIFQALKPES